MKLCFMICLMYVSVINSQSGTIANYVYNGGLEEVNDCTNANPNLTYLCNAKNWDEIDLTKTTRYGNYCLNNVPYNGFGFQFPRTGKAYVIADFFVLNVNTDPRTYLRNKLKSNLISGKIYCVKFYVNVGNQSSSAIDGFGVYFGDNTLDTITQAHKALTYLTPQIQNPVNNLISDTLNWIPITGTFVATGTEKYMVIGNFKSDAATNYTMLYSTAGFTFSTISVDDVSCIPLDLLADAGPDKSCKIGDSVYIGRHRDVGIDEACMWYKLPITITPTTPAIDTAAGIYVKPTQTSTYVVKQEICGNVKWDTVIVYKDGVGLNNLELMREDISIYPNPTKNKINFTYNQNLNAAFNLSISNLLGQQIYYQKFFKLEEEVDISFLPAGIYYLKIKNESGQKVFKVLKE